MNNWYNLINIHINEYTWMEIL